MDCKGIQMLVGPVQHCEGCGKPSGSLGDGYHQTSPEAQMEADRHLKNEPPAAAEQKKEAPKPSKK